MINNNRQSGEAFVNPPLWGTTHPELLGQAAATGHVAPVPELHAVVFGEGSSQAIAGADTLGTITPTDSGLRQTGVVPEQPTIRAAHRDAIPHHIHTAAAMAVESLLSTDPVPAHKISIAKLAEIAFGKERLPLPKGEFRAFQRALRQHPNMQFKGRGGYRVVAGQEEATTVQATATDSQLESTRPSAAATRTLSELELDSALKRIRSEFDVSKITGASHQARGDSYQGKNRNRPTKGHPTQYKRPNPPPTAKDKRLQKQT